MSKELKWCKSFMNAVYLRGHKRYRTRKKNIHRVDTLLRRALHRWGHLPYPPEWKENK